MRSNVQHLVRAIAVTSACLGLAASAFATPDRVTVAWDPNPEPDIAGYNVYYGVVGSGVTNKVSPGTATQQQVISLKPQTQYWFYVTAFNTAGLESDPSQVLNYTTPVNQAPTVTLSGDKIAIIPGTIAVKAEASDDYLTPDQLTATWSQVSGPATVGIAGGSKFAPAFNFSVPGTYVFRVTVSDGVSSAQDEATIYAYQQVTDPPPGTVVPDIAGIYPSFDGMIIQWDSQVGANYRLAHKSDLNESTWTIIADNIASQGPTTYWVDGSGQFDQQGFYAIFQIP
ncbi:hypothetical protein GC207_12140 [bacterium]|nr:hypothetical protein [bacterium]